MRAFLPPLLAAALPVALAAQAEGQGGAPQAAVAEAPVRGRLRNVVVDGADVFDGRGDLRWLERLVNALHWQTRAATIRRELFFAPGDDVDAAQAAELERNLRALGLFAEVEVRLVATGTPGEVDLLVRTRDRLTLNFGAGGSYVGGVTGVRASVGESNLFGLGDRIALSFAQNSEDEFRGALSYQDLHLLDTWHQLGLRAAVTDDGESYGAEVRRPTKHLADPRSYQAAFDHVEDDAEYFRNGESVAQVAVRRSVLDTGIQWASGPRDSRRALGLQLRYDQRDYEAARGPLAPEIDVPGDTRSVHFGPTARWRWITGFRKVEGIDTLQFVQDVVLGLSADLSLGARWRDEALRGSDLQPELGGSVAWAAEPLSGVLTNFGTSGAIRWDSGDTAGWSSSTFARAYLIPGQRLTIGLNAIFDAVEETQDLPVELTLGEDNGLRGYPARELSGTRRLRANLEPRYDTGIEVLTLRFGLIAFHDAGWVGRGSDLGAPFASAGVGLRIGSKPLLGDGVLRIDLAKPLDSVVGEDDGWQVSVSIGQVFTFGANTSTAGAR